MSLAFCVHAEPLVLHELATHWPVPVLQIWPPVHCVSLVHLPQKFGCVAPQMEPFALAAQSLFARQSPGVHDPDRHRLFAP
jgi:hypothetical protein